MRKLPGGKGAVGVGARAGAGEGGVGSRGVVCSRGPGRQASTASAAAVSSAGPRLETHVIKAHIPPWAGCPLSPRAGSGVPQTPSAVPITWLELYGVGQGRFTVVHKENNNNTKIKPVLCPHNYKPTFPHAVYHPHFTVPETEPRGGATAAQGFRVPGPGPPALGMPLVPGAPVAVLGGSAAVSLTPGQV